MKVKKYLAAAAVASLAVALPSPAMTLAEARTLAAERYPLVRDYDLIALTEEYSVENASKAWLPQVQAGAQATWQSAVASYPAALTDMLKMQGVDIKGLDKFQYKVSVDVQQTIWDGGRIRAAQKLLRAESAESRARLEVDMYQLRQRVDNLYFAVLLLEQQRDAIARSQALLQANFDKMNALVRNGAAMQSDADAVNVELLSTGQQLASVEASIRAYRAMLTIYTGCDCGELTVPEEKAVPASDDASLRPEMSLFNARKSLLDAKEKELDKSLMPQIGAFAQGFFGYPGLNFMEAMMKRDPGFNAMVGVSASWNIGALYTRKNNLRTIEANRQRIDAARDVFSFNTDLLATQQRHELTRLRDISASDKEIIDLRERVRSAAEARLREGVAEPTELLLRITEEKNARIAANSHKIEYLKALYSLLTTLNQ